MTKRDNEVLQTIARLTAARKHPPTIRELARALNVTSTATVSLHLERLKRLGKITWSPRTPRTIVIVENAA